MKIKRIYNNADNHEINHFVLFAKYDTSKGVLDATSTKLFKDSKCTEAVTYDEMNDIKGCSLIIEAKDPADKTTNAVLYYPNAIYCLNDSPIYVEVIQTDNDGVCKAINFEVENPANSAI